MSYSIVEVSHMTNIAISTLRYYDREGLFSNIERSKGGIRNSTSELRRTMFYERLKIMNQKMELLQKTIDTIKYKCWYYDTAVQNGTEIIPQNMPFEDMPADIQEYKVNLTTFL